MMKSLHANHPPGKPYQYRRSLSTVFCFLLVAGLLMSVAGFAQVTTVSGTVTSSDDGSPLPGVTVIECYRS
jgi:hypothetical protein